MGSGTHWPKVNYMANRDFLREAFAKAFDDADAMIKAAPFEIQSEICTSTNECKLIEKFKQLVFRGESIFYPTGTSSAKIIMNFKYSHHPVVNTTSGVVQCSYLSVRPREI